MSNRYSTFPDALDQLKLLSEVQEMTGIQKQKVARYSELALETSFTGAEEVEFQALYQDLKGFQLNSSDWNKVVETLMNTQRYIKETVMGDVGVLIDNAEVNIGNTVIAAKGEINTLKANTFVELAQKVSQIVSDGVVGIDFFKGRSIASGEVSSITISVSQYNKSSDFLMVHINGALVSEGINYTVGTDGYSIKAISSTWAAGTVFDFIVLKKTIVLLENYDAGLFEDGSIRKEKLNQEVQDAISDVKNKQNSTDENLITENKKIVPAINEISFLANEIKTKGQPNGIATLGSNGILEDAQMYKVGDMKVSMKAPTGKWLLCDGSLLPYTSTYVDLGNYIGGDSISTFLIRLTVTTSFQLYCVTYGNGVYVAVGSNAGYSQLYSSTDGVSWIKRTVTGESYWKEVIYGDNRFVAVGDSGYIAYSTDGISWTTTRADTTTLFNSVTYGDGVYVAVGDAGKTYYSTNGATWTYKYIGANDSINSVTFGKNIFVAVGNGGYAYSSTDGGVTWSRNRIMTSGYYMCLKVIYNGSYFITFTNYSDQNIYWGYDGVSWNKAGNFGLSLTGDNKCFFYANGTYFISDGTATKKSTNLSTWTSTTLPGTAGISGLNLYNGIYVNDKIFLVGSSNMGNAILSGTYGKLLPKVDMTYIRY